MKPEEIYKEIQKLTSMKEQLNEEIVGELFMFRLAKRINELWDEYRNELKNEIVVECSRMVIDYE